MNYGTTTTNKQHHDTHHQQHSISSNTAVTTNDTANSHGSHEQDSLLPRTHNQNYNNSKSDQHHKSRQYISRLRKHLSTPVNKKRGDLVLLLCYVITGLLDSTATAIWGAFVSMQTGNTIYFGLGLSHPTLSSPRWIKSGLSIASFCLGSFFFARLHRLFGQKVRWVLMFTFTLQLLLIVASGIIVILRPGTRPNDGHDLHWHVLSPLCMIAFQSAGQAVVSRALQFGPLTSVVLTSNYCDLFMDAKLFAGLTENQERNRRVAAPLLVLLGAFLGGVWSRSAYGIAGALWLAAALKAVIVLVWFFWQAEKQEEN